MIDDERNLNVDVIARTSEAGIKLLEAFEWECLILDHDLGSDPKTGYDILVYALEKNILPKCVQIITMNPVGRERIKNALISTGYVENGPNFILAMEKEEKHEQTD
jgi:hypothetical protein